MDQGFIGTEATSMMPWYWIAVGSSIVLALLLRSIPLARWREWRQLRRITGGLVLLGALLVLAWIDTWQSAAMILGVMVIQWIIHIVIQHAWMGQHDMDSWFRRYEWLPGIIVFIPIYAWWQVLAPEQILFDGPEQGILLTIIMILYLSGLLISNIQWSRQAHMSRSIKTLYLCALELTPLLWVAKASL